MPSKELLLEFKELLRIGVQCPKCQAETLFDLSRGTVPFQCNCGEKYDKPLQNALYQLQDLYRDLARYTIRVHFNTARPASLGH
jgi:hypothetical protein